LRAFFLACEDQVFEHIQGRLFDTRPDAVSVTLGELLERSMDSNV
jgi:hypothetical protein